MTPPQIRTSDRLIAVVESFLVAPSQTLSQVSVACELELPTAMRYLGRLVEHGWLERDDSSRIYTLGVRLLEIGHSARLARPMRKIALPFMRELLARFDETVNLAVHQAGEVVVVEALESGRSIRRGASVGDRDSWFVSSLGKSILAQLPDREVERLLAAHPPVRQTKKTRINPADIFADLADVRRCGYALDDEEAELGLKCVGVPIPDLTGDHCYALSISGPTARIDDRLEEITDALRDVAIRLDPASRVSAG